MAQPTAFSAQIRGAVLAASAAFSLSGCAAPPRTPHDAAYDEPASDPRDGDAEPEPAEAPPAQAVVVVLGEPPPAAPGDGWVPEDTHGDNPFERNRLWVGDYDCPQGRTQLTFRVVQASASSVKALFEFNHIDSGAAGAYLMMGRYDERTRTASFVPGAWIVEPPNYVTVRMEGDVAFDGSLFAGRIQHPGCGAFRLRPAG